MFDEPVSRREFVQAAMVTVAASAVGFSAAPQGGASAEVSSDIAKTRNYNPDMDYRRLGSTGLWVSAVAMGGHWKRVDKAIGASMEINPYEGPDQSSDMAPFLRNRDEVISRCLEVGINCLDLAGNAEAETYCKVLGDRRDRIYLCYSHPKSELREPENRDAKKLVELFEAGLKRCNIEYADVWRLMALERGGRHSQADVDAMIEALNTARDRGLCRYTGFSTHDREWAKMLIETYPDPMQVLCTPYTATSQELPQDSLFDAVRKHDVGILGIKPFASNAIFKGDGSPDGPHVEEDNESARLAIRNILANPAITAPIPGLVSAHQVDNVVRAVKESRTLDTKELARLDEMRVEMLDRLPADHQWLKEWQYV